MTNNPPTIATRKTLPSRPSKRNPLSNTFPFFIPSQKKKKTKQNLSNFYHKFPPKKKSFFCHFCIQQENNSIWNWKEIKVVKCNYPIMVILREDLRGSWESKTESSASLEAMSFGYRSFWRLGNTVVNSQIRRFNSPTESSAQTRTVYSFPLHFTVSVSSSSDTDDDVAVEAEAEAEAEAAIDCYFC